ncbi:hypothetical protein LOZ80_12090 [Paenibacillus sp. HWE-109]|uniref:CDI toxin immunity protein n=1 Tax=Paenibacillus sp. HWE-109 TaxID=1306526 RepID=UPI001EDD4EF1|nr:hypothetical protein [Paenibacillus sp. HWE-109]UKS29625.1 hypothetical protein LOZ80_12090 [Paenibacillus sp. HWE-109]
MNGKQDRKWRLEQLLNKQKLKHKEEFGVLFEECVNALGEGTNIYSKEKSDEIYDYLGENYPFSPWSRIDWENVNYKMVVGNVNEIETILIKKYGELIEENVFILWSYGDFPVLQAQLHKAISAIDDLLAVSSDVYFLSPSKYVIELYHDGEITIGFKRR